MEAMITKLQTTLIEQESDILNLSGELYAQQKEIAVLKKQYADLTSRIKSLSEGDSAVQDASSEPPPPHY